MTAPRRRHSLSCGRALQRSISSSPSPPSHNGCECQCCGVGLDGLARVGDSVDAGAVGRLRARMLTHNTSKHIKTLQCNATQALQKNKEQKASLKSRARVEDAADVDMRRRKMLGQVTTLLPGRALPPDEQEVEMLGDDGNFQVPESKALVVGGSDDRRRRFPAIPEILVSRRRVPEGHY